MAHFGAYTTRIPGIWLYESMQLGKKYNNVYADLSSVGLILNRDCVVNEIHKTIGFNRMLFATGYPKPLISAITMASMVSAIKTNLHLTEKEK
jgi:predicted TIM-barrel fold metal-dependent hydrolase